MDSLQEIENFYWRQNEPQRSCFLALREIIKSFHPDLTEEWKYKLPFFYFKGKMFCYLWKDKKTGEPYIGISGGYKIEHPYLLQGDRKWVKIFQLNSQEDIPMKSLKEVLDLTIGMHLKK